MFGLVYSGRAVEQRRSPRHATRIAVDLFAGKATERGTAIDVGRHGLFIACKAKVEERQLVQLVISLPRGPLSATAVVSHVRSNGAGFQLFALSSMSKHHWDEFVYGIAERSDTPLPAQTGPDVATFLIKLRNVNRLLEFYDQNVRTRSLYLTTPVLKEQGAEVALNMIHPASESEFVLHGHVASVCMVVPKGMEIRLDRMSDESIAAFREFVTTGSVPNQTPRVLAPEMDVEPEPPSEDISIDIEVDESALEDSAQFFWNDVTQDDLIIDFDTSGFSEAKEGTSDLAPVDPTTLDLVMAPDRDILVAVRCRACKTDYGTVRLGPARGVLGALASHQPYWWPKEKKIVSILRLNTAMERRAKRDQLGELDLNKPMSLRLGFKIAEMSAPPRCPDGGSARVTPIVKALKAALPQLATQAPASRASAPTEETAESPTPRQVQFEKARCTSCHERSLVAERWD